MRLVPLQVVDDAIARRCLDAVRMLVEREVQWKYWPPSITIVWPVTKLALDPER